MVNVGIETIVSALTSGDHPGAFVLVRDGHVLQASRNASKMLGPLCMEGALSDRLHAQSRAKFEQALASRRPVTVEVLLERPDRDPVGIELYVIPLDADQLILLDAARPAEGLVEKMAASQSAVADVARELARRSHELEQAEVRLRELLAVRDEMITSLSHDLNNAMQTMLLSSKLLAESSGGNVRLQAERLVRSTQRAIFLTANVVEAARTASPDATIANDPVDLRELAFEVIDAVRPLADQREVRLEERTSTSTPAALGDRPRLFRALVNLVDNAIRHSPRHAAVSIRSEALDGRRVRCSVIDSGPGVPRDLRQLIFNRFRQGEQPGSAGLGLSIVRRIAELHGGRVFLDEAYERGAAFVLELPATPGRGRRIDGETRSAAR